MKRLILLMLLLVLVVGGYYYSSLKNSPSAALLQAAAATQTHDVAAFERYVDIDALTGHLVDDVASQSGALGMLVPGGGLALRSSLGLLKPQIAKAARTELQRYVETGSLEAARAAAPHRLVNLSFLGLAGRVVSPGSKFKGIKYTTEQGDDALVGLEFEQPRSDSTLVVEVKMHKLADGHWQANQITNTGTLLKRMVQLEKSQLLK